MNLPPAAPVNTPPACRDESAPRNAAQEREDSRIDSSSNVWALFSTVNKFVLLLLPVGLIGLAGLTGCTTLENRRDMYSPQRVEGPYTRMLRERPEKPDAAVAENTQTTTSRSSGSYKNVSE